MLPEKHKERVPQVKQTENKLQPSDERTALWLLFLISFAVHAILNIWVNRGPTVIIDEGLYTNIARSLAWDGEVAFRAQPVNYPNLLYPLLLVPVYWLNRALGGDIYRYIQVFNTLLVTSSVFPVYLFSRDFTGNRDKSILTAVLVCCIPDMLMGGYTMTESLLWPLALWLIFFCYRLYRDGEMKYALLAGLFTALMFYAKPGAVAMGAGMLLFYLLAALRHDRAAVRKAVCAIALTVALIILFYAVYFILYGNSSTRLVLYDKQTSELQMSDILVMIEATFLLTFLFVFASGGVFAIVPVVYFKRYSEKNRPFILAFLLSLAAVIVGTAVFVIPYKWDSSLGALPLHTRYYSMYIPVFLVLSFGLEVPQKKQGKAIRIALAVFMALCLFPGVRSGFVRGHTGTVDSVTLSAFHTTSRVNSDISGWIITLFEIAATFYAVLAIEYGWKDTLKKICAGFFAVLMLFNSVCAHINAFVPIEPTVGRDALEVNRAIGTKECLGITQRYYDNVYSYWLDGRLNTPMQEVTMDQMVVQMARTQGVYSPFVPLDQAPNVNNHETPDTDTFVLGITIADHLELSDSVKSSKTQNGYFTVATITPGERWVDTIFYGLDNNTLAEGENGFLYVFDPNRSVNGNLIIRLTASGSELEVAGKTVLLDESAGTYEITVPFAYEIPIHAVNGDATIEKYTTARASQ